MNSLKKYLKYNGISIRRFSQFIGTTPNNLGLIVNGKRTPTIKLAWEIEKNTMGSVTLHDWIPEEPDLRKEIRGKGHKLYDDTFYKEFT